MMTNVGVVDRVLRLIAGSALLAWAAGYFGNAPAGWAGTAMTAAAAYAALTGFLRWCPIFALAKITTCDESP